MGKDHINKTRSAVLSEKSKDFCAYLNHSWLAILLYHTAKFQKNVEIKDFIILGQIRSRLPIYPKRTYLGEFCSKFLI